jgi:hypothetical protein
MRLMSQELPLRGSSGYTKRKLLLVTLIVGLGGIIFFALEFLYQSVKSTLGMGLAIAIVAGVTIVIMFMLLVGIILGSALDMAIRRRNISFKSITTQEDWLDLFLKLLGSKIDVAESLSENAQNDDMPPGVTMNDVEDLLLITEQRKRGGKKSLHPDDVQYRAVRDWMIMQSRGTSVTLQQFLEERFGVAPETGMPLVPNQTFYGWRKKFLKALKNYKHQRDRHK